MAASAGASAVVSSAESIESSSVETVPASGGPRESDAANSNVRKFARPSRVLCERSFTKILQYKSVYLEWAIKQCDVSLTWLRWLSHYTSILHVVCRRGKRGDVNLRSN